MLSIPELMQVLQKGKCCVKQVLYEDFGVQGRGPEGSSRDFGIKVSGLPFRAALGVGVQSPAPETG